MTTVTLPLFPALLAPTDAPEPEPTVPEPIPHALNSRTSKAAAESIRPHLSRLERVVLSCLGMGGELTDDGMQARTGLDGNTQRARRVKLEERGLVERTGGTAKTRKGRDADLWRVTDDGRAALAGEGRES